MHVATQHDSGSDTSLSDDEALLVLNVARTQREVSRAKQALGECLAIQHESIAKLYQFLAQSSEQTTDHLELAVGAIKVAMKQHGLSEPILPSSSISTRIHQIHCDPDGT